VSEKVCVIIGAGRGMGAATARLMHNKGYKLALMSPSESCETLAHAVYTRCAVVYADAYSTAY
jgi:NAD(P)-dependent dehydrogenase (short-subunit alcohol dehydrogenase family)